MGGPLAARNIGCTELGAYILASLLYGGQKTKGREEGSRIPCEILVSEKRWHLPKCEKGVLNFIAN